MALPDSDLPDKDAIVAALNRGAARPLKPKELARELDVSTSDYRDFKELLRALEDAGDIYRVHGGRYAPPDVSNLITGTLRVNSSGNGFVVPDGAGDDVFVAAADMDTALHGDKVIVKVERRRRHAPVGGPGRSGGTEGRVTKILARARTQFVGTVTRTRTTVVVTPADPRIARDVLVPLDQTLDAEDRQKVVVEVLSFGDYGGTPRGRIIEVLGNEGDPGVDVLAIIRHHNLPDAIPAEVEAAAHALPATIPPEEIARREDWRGVLVVTIDPVDAKDFDDALSLRRLDDDRWELGVHIADVSHYVKAGDTIDLEAYRRATSVYLVDRVIPMLPERLSNDLCSLKPEVDRLAMSVVMTVDAECRVQESRIADTVIHSRHRLTYEKVQAILEGDAVLRREYAGALDMVEGLHRLARQLTARRSARGSLDFDLPESRVLLDKEGLPMDIQKTVRLESHRLIEEFMVLANESVARHLRKKRIAGLFRVHEEPDALKIEQLVELITPLGYSLKRGKDGKLKPTALQELLARAEGRPEENLINTSVLRSMKRARYDERPLGHYGLASADYLHFTSPIRRYPDLIVHRALRQAAGVDPAPLRSREEWDLRLHAMAVHCSEREEKASEAERDSIDLKKAEFMLRHVGDDFIGTITGVTGFGLFVELDAYHVEGLVHVSSLGDDYYIFREDLMALVGENTSRSFRLGDRVNVRVAAVKKELRKIDFAFLGKEGEKSLDQPVVRPLHPDSRARAARKARAIFEGRATAPPPRRGGGPVRSGDRRGKGEARPEEGAGPRGTATRNATKGRRAKPGQRPTAVSPRAGGAQSTSRTPGPAAGGRRSSSPGGRAGGSRGSRKKR